MTDITDNTYPRWIPAPGHLLVQHKNKRHVYDYEYFTSRAGETYILVANEAQERGARLNAASLPRVSVKRIAP